MKAMNLFFLFIIPILSFRKRLEYKQSTNIFCDKMDHGEVEWDIQENYINKYSPEKYIDSVNYTVYVPYNDTLYLTNPIYSSIMNIIHEQIVNTGDTILMYEDITNINNINIFTILLHLLLKLRYDNYKTTENKPKVIDLVYYKKYNKIKQISYSLFLILFIVFYRNIHNAE
jgi:hypothetical protein